MNGKPVVIIFLLLLASSAALFFMPADEGSFERENRSRTELPHLTRDSAFSGEFASSFDSYVNDNIAFRSELIAAGRYIDGKKGVTPPDGKVIYADRDIGTETVQKACMLIADGKIMEVFSENRDAGRTYAAAINNIAENIPTDINVYAALVPTQLEFSGKVYSSVQSSQKNAIDDIYSQLDPRITGVDIYSSLENHTDEYIYFKSDHHWTMLGSYYGYTSFMRAQNKPAAAISNFEKHTQGEFYGYLYEQHPDGDIEKDVLEWYDTSKSADITVEMESVKDGKPYKYTSPMFDTSKSDYSFFFSADHPFTRITNNSILNGETLLVIKDSFASDFVPWCVNDYHTIIMVDPRTYKGNLRDLFNENSISDVLVLNYIFTTSFEDYCNMMIDMFK